MDRKSILSWALYDWANSAFATTVMAGFFPLFFNAYWADPNNPAESTFFLGLANSTYAIIVALMAPFLGAIADQGNSRKKFLIFFAFMGAVFTAALWLVNQGNWQLATIVYIAAAIGFSSGNIFYDSLLLTVAPRDKLNMVSSLGFSMGYIGGGSLFALNVFMFLKPSFFGISNQSIAVKLSFVSVAVWWILFSIPLILYVREPVIYNSVPIRQAVSLGFRQLMNTFYQLKHFKIVSLFLIAYWFYIDGVDTIVKMAVDYGMSIGFNSSTLMTALLMVQFIAFPAALGYNWVAMKIGTKEAVMTSIFAYIIITILGYFMTSETHFYILAILIGLFQGGIQALSRSLYSRIIPKSHAAEFFGFFNMLGKFAAVIGPLLIGSVTILTGSARLGILSIIVLFICGAFLLMLVDFTKGEQLAKEFESKTN
ncbi:MAG: MFS transporter [Candidatus Neomarinimicrobiota bacterium]